MIMFGERADPMRREEFVLIEEAFANPAQPFRRHERDEEASVDLPADMVELVEEVRAVLELLRVRARDWPGLRLYALCMTVAFTGLRRNEALHLKVEDVDLAERLLYIGWGVRG